MAWLQAAIDPFHDAPLKVKGLPDDFDGQTVCEVFTETMSLSAPAGTAGNWSAHIFSLPLAGTVDAFPTILHKGHYDRGAYYGGAPFTTYTGCHLGNCVDATGVADRGRVTFGPLNIWSYSTDSTLMFPGPVALNTACPAFFPAAKRVLGLGGGDGSDGSPVSTGLYRIIGAGIEVINTTSSLYKQGTLTVSRTPAGLARESTAVAATYPGTPGISPLNCVNAMDIPQLDYVVANAPPYSVAAATAFPNTAQWPAAEGCYTVQHIALGGMTMEGNESVGFITTSQRDYVSGTGPTPAPYATSFGEEIVSKMGDPTLTYTLWRDVPAQKKFVDGSISSIMLTGLSKESTFTIRYRFIVEKAPRLGDIGGADLVRLAHQSPLTDRIALKAYEVAMSSGPVGVPSRYNPLGEYWNLMVDIIKKAAPTIASVAGLIPHPIAQAVSKAASVAASAAGVASAAQAAVKRLEKKKEAPEAAKAVSKAKAQKKK